MKVSLLNTLLVAGLLCGYSNVRAVSSFLDTWRAEYPTSSSADLGCQLCHLQREGNAPWNAYGRDIRNKFNQLDPNSRTIEEAIHLVESFNSDSDSTGANNLTEINNNEQPGWRPGRVNNAYDRDDNIVGVFFPPVSIDPYPQKIPLVDYPIKLTEVATGFTAPLAGITAPSANFTKQLFVVDQVGVIWRVNLLNGEKSEYLNVQNDLISLGAFQPGGFDERGLLGFAFHPQFSTNGLVYLHRSEPALGAADFTTLDSGNTANHQSVILELSISNPNSLTEPANISSTRELLRVDQPQFNHNGGDLAFDDNGLLYIALGDGGGADDQGVGHGALGNGTDPSNPLGAILRIDPLGTNSNNGKYGIPTSNPFVTHSDRLDEIYAYGFRNPWKLSFDTNGRLYVADVGQNDIEEINLVEKGLHYGWRFREGSFFFDPNGEFSGLVTRAFPDNLPPEQLIDPIFEYDHDEGISISGGHLYRGLAHRTLFGKFIFADFQKRLFVGDLATGDTTATTLTPEIFIYSMARDASAELYIMGNATAVPSGTTGKLYRIDSTSSTETTDLCVPIKTILGNVSVICL